MRGEAELVGRRTLPRITLRRKLYGVAALLVVLAIALAANAILPLVKATGEVTNARKDVATALAAQETGRDAAAWFWHLSSLPLVGVEAERDHVVGSFFATREASAEWIRLERGGADAANTRALDRSFIAFGRDAKRVLDALSAGDPGAAKHILLDRIFRPSTESYALPLDRAIRREASEMRVAFVRLAGATGAAGPLTNGHLTEHVLEGRTRSELSLAASGFIRLRLIHAQLLAGVLLDPAASEPALASVMDLVARNEFDVWSGLADASGSPDVVATADRIGDADARVSAIATALFDRLRRGDMPGAQRAFATSFAPAVDAEIRAVDEAIAADERVIASAMSDVVAEHRGIAVVMALVALGALSLALVSGFAARRIARRLATTTAAVRSFTPEEHVPIAVDGHDEISELASAFDAMALDVGRAREQEKRFIKRTVEATESERMQLAAELHDGPIQRLTGLLYGLERYAGRVERGQLDGLDDFMGDARRKISAEVGALRHLLSELRPPVLDERGLSVAVGDYLSEFARREGIECDVDVRLDARVSESLETTMYRILQEALANVSKHADATRVHVALWDEDGSVHLHVADDGKGFDPHEARENGGGEHFGVAGMAGRARYAGGWFDIDSAPGRGTIVSATLPTALRKAS